MSHGNNKLARLARPHAERAIQRPAAIVDDGYQSAGARVAAARALLEFGYGRPGRRRSGTESTAVIPPAVQIEWGDPTE